MESTESDIHLDNLLEEAMEEIYDVTGDQKVSSEEDQVENAELEELEELDESTETGKGYNVQTSIVIPVEFSKIAVDFIQDITTTFPEYEAIVKKWWGMEDYTTRQTLDLFNYCYRIYPPRFTDIIYQNNEIFSLDSDINVDFLPGISFKSIMECEEITENTRTTIWKYLQMILLSVVGSGNNKDGMNGEMQKIFKGLDEDTFKGKLEETVQGIQSMFEKSKATEEAREARQTDASGEEASAEEEDADEGSSTFNFQEQLEGMMQGKIGKLAHDIARETTNSIDMDQFEGTENAGEVFNKIFSGSGNLMGLVQNISSKLDNEIKSGNISHSDLMHEATGLLQNMQGIQGVPGMENIQSFINTAMQGAASAAASGESPEEGGDSGSSLDFQSMVESMMGGQSGRGRDTQTRVDTNAVERHQKKTNQITQMKQRIERKKLQQALLAKQIEDAKKEAENSVLSEDEIQKWVEEEDAKIAAKETADKASSKKKKSKNKK